MATAHTSLHLMGTVIDIQITHANAHELLQRCVKQLFAYEHIFSANDPTATLMQVNANAGKKPVTVPAPLFALIKFGKQHSLEKTGNLNVTLGAVVKAWHIGFADARVPNQATLQQALALSDPHQIELDEVKQQVYLKKAGMEIDLGSLAKGYISDLLVTQLLQANVSSACLNLGGNVYVLGQHTNRPWHVGIQQPRARFGVNCAVVAAANAALVTSGVYERTLTKNGRTYHHIFDKHTGQPLTTDVQSLTIIAPSALEGELWTTQLFGLPPEEILKQVAPLPNIEAIIVLADGTIKLSQPDLLTQPHCFPRPTSLTLAEG